MWLLEISEDEKEVYIMFASPLLRNPQGWKDTFLPPTDSTKAPTLGVRHRSNLQPLKTLGILSDGFDLRTA